MEGKYLKNLPQWYKETAEHDLVLSDDIDSLVSVNILRTIKSNWRVGYFYDFDKLYVSAEAYEKEHKPDRRVWCDIACLKKEKCFDNHVSRRDTHDKFNPLCINPNLMANVTSKDYTRKYAGSTALLIWSIYDIPLPETEEGKMLLLCIDSTFKGYYDERFRGRNKFYLCDMFGFNELYELEQRHTKDEFYKLINKFGLSAKIICADGKLETKLDLKTIGELLGIEISLSAEKEFMDYVEFEEFTSNMCGKNSIHELSPKIITLAFTFQNNVKYSVMKKKLKKTA